MYACLEVCMRVCSAHAIAQIMLPGPQVSDRLAERNRRLRQVHSQLSRIVVGLMDTDLVRHKDR